MILFLKRHPTWLRLFWACAACALRIFGCFVRVRPRTVLFSSFGGRNFDDSPRALYDAMCRDPFFADYDLVWAFTDPGAHVLPRGRAVTIDTPAFFHALLYSRIWIGNSGITRGIPLSARRHIRIETWHGTPLKRIEGEERQTAMHKAPKKAPKKVDRDTIRCAQSTHDRAIFSRVFAAAEESFLLCDLPRNDALSQNGEAARLAMRESLHIPAGKKVILYMPTYREYAINPQNELYLAPPITPDKWRATLGEEYVVLVRAHYAVRAALSLPEDGFFYDVSTYPAVNDLYIVADMLLSDYSSAFIDYAILERPMGCFAYDLAEYEEKRGLYVDLEKTLPCPIWETEDAVLAGLQNGDAEEARARTVAFKQRFAPYAGHATACVLTELKNRLSL